METKWTWGKDGRSVTVNGTTFKVKESSTSEAIVEYGEELVISAQVHHDLCLASTAFTQGQAPDYSNGRERARHLIMERTAAGNELQTRTADFIRFFEPDGIAKAFNGDKESFPKFVVDAIGQLAKARPDGKRTP